MKKYELINLLKDIGNSIFKALGIVVFIDSLLDLLIKKFFIQLYNSETYMKISSLIWLIAFCVILIKIVYVWKKWKKEFGTYMRNIYNWSQIGYMTDSLWDALDKLNDTSNLATIIGINNRFTLDRKRLSDHSLVSEHLEKYSDSELEEIKADITETLKKFIIGCDGDEMIYQYGIIYKLPKPQKYSAEQHYDVALLSMCEPVPRINKRYRSSVIILKESFDKMFQQMGTYFTDYTVVLPLIGTASAGTYMSCEKTAKYLITNYIEQINKNNGRLSEKLILALGENNVKNDFINPRKIKRHIDYECN